MWDPFDEIRKMHREMDNMFRRFFSSHEKLFGKELSLRDFREPLSHIKENDKEIIVELELPGVNKEDVVLQVSNDVLEVRAKKESEIKIAKKGYSRHEKSFSGYYTKLALPSNVKTDEVESEFKNGVLKVKLPKSKEKIARKMIIK